MNRYNIKWYYFILRFFWNGTTDKNRRQSYVNFQISNFNFKNVLVNDGGVSSSSFSSPLLEELSMANITMTTSMTKVKVPSNEVFCQGRSVGGKKQNRLRLLDTSSSSSLLSSKGAEEKGRCRAITTQSVKNQIMKKRGWLSHGKPCGFHSGGRCFILT